MLSNRGAQEESYRLKAGELEMAKGATRVAVHRLRQRYGELFRQAVADTVEHPEEIADEMRHLVSVLSSSPRRQGLLGRVPRGLPREFEIQVAGQSDGAAPAS